MSHLILYQPWFYREPFAVWIVEHDYLYLREMTRLAQEGRIIKAVAWFGEWAFFRSGWQWIDSDVGQGHGS